MNKLLQTLGEIKTLLSLNKPVLTLDEFCLYAGITKSYAYHLTSSGKVKFYRPFGKMIYFDRDEVTEFLKSNSKSTNASIKKAAINNFLK